VRQNATESPLCLKTIQKKIVAELKLDQDLSPKTTKARILESAKGLMAKIHQICESEGDSWGCSWGMLPLVRKGKFPLGQKDCYGKHTEQRRTPLAATITEKKSHKR